jgi:6-phosphogluconolactonase/glucosamine-6-phosphate isomerase/deaminase
MGADGHTAGIFTSSDAAALGGQLAHTSESPLYPKKRMTISAWVFRRSEKIVVGLRGLDKKQSLEAALGGAVLPISLVAGDKGVFLYLDSDGRK